MKNNELYYSGADFTSYHMKQLQDAKEGIDLSLFVNARPEMEINDGIATISVRGMLLSNSAPIQSILGNTDYQNISEEIDSAVNQGVKGIVFDFNSGGGMVLGCIEIAQKIQNLGIPTVAYAEGYNCSASYKLCCGTDYIVSSPSCENGNIGSIQVLYDDTRMLEAFGVDRIALTSEGAALKSTGHAGYSDEQIEFLQDKINQSGEVFRNHVLANRTNLDPVVFKAGWYSGQESIDLGLIDAIGSRQDSLNVLLEILDVLES
tara:strand:+ start:348 stop:1133 length:786 start_codon:yes stop_codon:yes gene_type:complete